MRVEGPTLRSDGQHELTFIHNRTPNAVEYASNRYFIDVTGKMSTGIVFTVGNVTFPFLLPSNA